MNSIPLQPSFDLSSLKQFVREKVLPGVLERDEKQNFPLEIYRDLHQLGWLHSFIPTSLGGLGASAVDLAFIVREIAYGSPGVASSYVANCLGLGAILMNGRPELREKVSKDVLGNFSLCSFGMTEGDVGTDIAHIKTRAKRVKGGYLLQGSKSFITNASYSRHLTVFAQCEGSNGKGFTAFYVPGDAKGLSRGKPLRKLGQSESDTTELYLDDVFVPEEHRLGEEGKGFRVAFHSLERSKTLLAANAQGLCDRAFDLAEGYAEERIRYGKPLLTLSTIQSALALLHTEAQAAWLLTLHAAATWDNGTVAMKEASMAKLYGADIAVKVANEALELMGGTGYTKECEIQRLYRDAKMLEIVEGGSLVQQVVIAKEIYADRLARTGTVLKKAA